MKLSITTKILIGFILGVVIGQILHTTMTPEAAAGVAKNFQIVSKIFLKLIKMIVGPLVFCTLAVGIAKLGDFKVVGRIGIKTLLYFYFATILSLLTGLIVVNLTRPGEVQQWPRPAAGADVGVAGKSMKSIEEFILHIFPDSFFMALAENEVLQIVIFSLFFGVALGAVGESGKKIVNVLHDLSDVVFKIVGYIMQLAPFAVLGAMTGIVALKGLGILISYAYLMLCFFGGLLFFVFVILWGICLFMKIPYLKLLAHVKDAVFLSFSTASSEASFPQQIVALEKFGCSQRIIGFVLPLGYSFNLDGSMMYMTFATGFIAQAYGVTLTIEQQIAMLLTLMITSKGIAGVPRASLVIIAGTLTQFGLPVEGLALILGIDPFLDMGRSATSVIGNAVATAVVSKMEGEYTGT
ncbi:MAG: dicarboxylate/amino acid:cation symporter [Cytophagia bacterium]|nr:MAG: dicarboxylate/amino acid:cation symporter [Cytophagales bacterium]TAG18107.1 MAG: dicarboxylate/amino acid:cation symporter [Cytophagales bacterium]TAG37646.1 MAG: dicarboxylate/amino acid:cation symporter [Cytophagia bacterium]TAG78782.1 MAG: dicarboxylate/amino acid:cation symporter [Cytophagales bacterium]